MLYHIKISITGWQNLIEFSESNLKSYLESLKLNNLINFVVLKANFLFYRTSVAGSSKTRCSYRINSLCYAFALYRFVVYYDLDQMQMTHTSCPLVLFLVTASQRSFSVATTTVFVSSGGRLVVMLRVELGTMGLHMLKG